MNFERPSNIPDHADLCLKAISDAKLGDRISLGGAFGLLHYLDYRPTYDVDAWWVPSATSDEQRRVIAAIEQALTPFGEVRTRAWGDVVSVELLEGKHKVFSFQSQTLAGNDADAARARLALQIHLERIALHRPLSQIEDPGERAEAQYLRLWFVEEFING